MSNQSPKPDARRLQGLLRGLARDASGNTMAMVAAGIVPLMAMIGGGIDMSRSYMAQTRLQTACDAGVLAARKTLGSSIVSAGAPPSNVAGAGNSFFNINFRAGAFGTQNRTFAMTVNSDQSIDGVATVEVPTTLMTIFGYSKVPIKVNCTGKLNFSNTDIMMVLDTTKSMLDPPASGGDPKMTTLRSVVKDFYAKIESIRAAGTRVRYGFVPYSTNVNVGTLLQSNWLVDNWTYQSRTPKYVGDVTNNYYSVDYLTLSGSTSPIAPYQSLTCPADTVVNTYTPSVTISTTPDSYYYTVTQNGADYNCYFSDGKYTVSGTQFNNITTKVTYTFAYTATVKSYTYTYKPMKYNVSAIKNANPLLPPNPGPINVQIYPPNTTTGAPTISQAWFNGCIEERDTYEITDYNNVDFSKALDLNLDLIPSGSDKTQWRPQFTDLPFARSMWWDGTGTWTQADTDMGSDFLNPTWSGNATCPTTSKRLQTWDTATLGTYVDSLVADGETYHDIGMIWGGRLISPTGLFASDNADVNNMPTSRHLIFLTDGITQPYDVSYSSYGIEPLDQRRLSIGNIAKLKTTIESRFGVACAEVKKKNVSVWVIGFDTTLNKAMTDCAGPGHYFEAKDAASLANVFSTIAASMGDLRLAK